MTITRKLTHTAFITLSRPVDLRRRSLAAQFKARTQTPPPRVLGLKAQGGGQSRAVVEKCDETVRGPAT